MPSPEKTRVLRYHMPAEKNPGAFPVKENGPRAEAEAPLRSWSDRPLPGLELPENSPDGPQERARAETRLKSEQKIKVRSGMSGDFQQLNRWLKALFSQHPAALLDLAAERPFLRPAIWLLAPELLLLPLFSLGYYVSLYNLYWPQTAVQGFTGAIYGNGLAAALLLTAACFAELFMVHLLSPVPLPAKGVLSQTAAVLLPLALTALPGGLLFILWPAAGSVLFLAAFAAHEALLWKAADRVNLPDRLRSVWIFCALSMIKWLLPFAYLGLFQ
ncbi:hypothetical protein HCH52_08150 [Oscillospiraceae bacterium HV4-5-C5C]|nr:hypothetical protein [Oscillospiraceae bacterium HV4-5-C5C]